MSPTLRKLLLAGIAATIAAVTLVPSGGALDLWSLAFREQRARLLAEAVGNVVLFIPLGAAAALALTGWARPLAAGVAMSVFIELTQLGIAGRYSTSWDVVLNTIGATSGVALARRIEISRLPTIFRHRLLSGAALVCALTVLIAGSALYRSDIPQDLLIGRWASGDASGDAAVVRAKVGSVTVLPRPINNSAELRRHLMQGSPIEVALRAPATPPTRLTSLFSVVDQHQIEILVLSVERSDLVLRYRSRATAWTLTSPEVRARAALVDAMAGELLLIRVWRDRTGWCVTVDSYERCRLGFRLADVWSLFVPPVAFPVRTVLTLAWLVALFFPAGYWTRRQETVIAAAIALVTLWAAPFFLHAAMTSPTDLLAATAGLTLGRLVGSRRQQASGRQQPAATTPSERVGATEGSPQRAGAITTQSTEPAPAPDRSDQLSHRGSGSTPLPPK